MSDSLHGSTLRTLVARQNTLYACCSNYGYCRHSADLRVEMLVQRLGWDFDLYERREELLWRLICSQCGTRHPDTIIVMSRPSDRYKGVGAAHAHQAPMTMEEIIARQVARSEAARIRDAALGILPHPGGRRRRFGR